MKFPLDNGICLTCVDRNDCLMDDMLRNWRIILNDYGDNVKESHPDIWKEHSVDKPDINNNGVITWCPHYSKRKDRRVKKAAYIRSDGVLATGKSHYDIISNSPHGTCKAGSTSGFIDNYNQFITREEAWKIAGEAGQLVHSKIRKSGQYLLSEEIWSDTENGQWKYDEEKGYVER